MDPAYFLVEDVSVSPSSKSDYCSETLESARGTGPRGKDYCSQKRWLYRFLAFVMLEVLAVAAAVAAAAAVTFGAGDSAYHDADYLQKMQLPPEALAKTRVFGLLVLLETAPGLKLPLLVNFL